MTNDITAISAIALKAISARMISPMESAVANRAGSMENLAYAPIRCLCPQNGRWRVRREAADIEHRPPRG
jgi:hypothetical protein